MKREPLNYKATFANGEELYFHGDNRGLAADHAEMVARHTNTSVERVRFLQPHERPEEA